VRAAFAAMAALAIGAGGAVAQQAPAAGESATELAKKLQNPIGDLYSFPFQLNTNFGVGPHDGTQNILNIQPVIPIHVNQDWNVITRTILPLVWTPDISPAPSVPFGTGPTTFSAFLSPSKPTNGWLWGAGPVIQVPTASDSTLGSSVWGAGPTAVLVYMEGPWVAGALANQVWSLGGWEAERGRGNKYSTFLTQPFVNYNFGEGWYVSSAPIITANWRLNGTKWTLPVGGQAGRVIRLGGKLPVNLALGAYYNAITPDQGAEWQMRTQITLIF
jgi:hypothetical protein